MLPWMPATKVTVNWLTAKLAETVRLAVSNGDSVHGFLLWLAPLNVAFGVGRASLTLLPGAVGSPGKGAR